MLSPTQGMKMTPEVSILLLLLAEHPLLYFIRPCWTLLHYICQTLVCCIVCLNTFCYMKFTCYCHLVSSRSTILGLLIMLFTLLASCLQVVFCLGTYSAVPFLALSTHIFMMNTRNWNILCWNIRV